MNYENHNQFFNSDGDMYPYGENGVLFTTEYAFLRDLYDGSGSESIPRLILSIEHILKPDREPLSHDNMTAIVCASHRYGFEYHKTYFHREWWWRAHPKDIFFYLYMKGGIAKCFGLLGLWFTILSGLGSCWSRAQSNGTLDTDGKLLHWLRIQACGWTFIGKISEIILNKRHGLGWDDIFSIYFHQKDHPNKELAREIYVQNR